MRATGRDTFETVVQSLIAYFDSGPKPIRSKPITTGCFWGYSWGNLDCVLAGAST